MEQNFIKGQEYEYNGNLYYIPKINNIKEFINYISENIKTDDDLLSNELDKYCTSCPIKQSNSDSNLSCSTCVFHNMNKNKYNALKLFFKNYGFYIDKLQKSEIDINNHELIELHDIFYKFFKETVACQHVTEKYEAFRFKKNLIAFRDALNKLNIDNKNTYSDVE